MACEDTRQLTEAQRVAGYLQQRTGVQQAVRPFTGRPTLDNLLDYINRELVPAVRQTRNAVNETYNQVRDNAPSGNPLQFYFSTETANADPTTGFVRLDAATQDTATTIRVSQTNGRLQDVAAWLDVMAGGATTPLGTITLFDAINPSRFLRFDLDTMVDQGAYWDLGVTIIESSHDNPFVDGGGLVVSFIPAVASSGATVPPGAITPIADDTFLANISGTPAAPSAVALTTLAGAGLTGGANAVLAVGAGDGIDVGADDVAVDVTDIIDNVTITEVATNNIQRAALTGFATAAAGSNATSSAEPIITYSASSNMSAERVLSNGTGTTIDIGTAGQVQVDIDTPLTDGDKGDITVSSNGTSWTIDNDVVSDAKLRNSAGLSVIGRATNTTGDPADIASTTPRHALITNSAGTAIGFRALETADIPAHTWAEVLAAGATSGANNPVISAGQYLGFGANPAAVGSTEQIRADGTLAAIASGGLQFAATGGACTFSASTNCQVTSGTTGFVILAAGTAGVAITTTGSTFTLQPASGSSVQFTRGFLDITEQASSTPSMAAGHGLLWVLSDTPNVPAFTDDANTDHVLQYRGEGMLADGDKGDITVTGSFLTWTIDNDVVTNAKLANMAQATVKGRAVGAGTGDPTDLTATELATLLATAPITETEETGAGPFHDYNAGSARHIMASNAAGVFTGVLNSGVAGDYLIISHQGTGYTELQHNNTSTTTPGARFFNGRAGKNLRIQDNEAALYRLLDVTSGGTTALRWVLISPALPFAHASDAATGDIVAFTGSEWNVLSGGNTADAVLRGNATFGTVSNAAFRDSGALAVVGRSANSSGDVADIQATASSGGVLRESGSTIGFGTISLAAFPTIADDTFLANIAGSTTQPTAVALSTLAGDGLQGGADAVLNIDVSDFAGTGLEDDGSENLRIAASAAGNGLTGGGGSALAVGAGTGITVAADSVSVTIPLTDGDKGDVTVSSSGTVWTVDNDAVSNAKAANMAQSTIKGRAVGAGTGDPQDLTGLQAGDIVRLTSGSTGFVSGTFNDYAITDGVHVLDCAPSGGNVTFTGFAYGSSNTGAFFWITKFGGSNTITIAHQSTGSASGNRVSCPGGVDFVMTRAGEGVLIAWNNTRLQVIATTRLPDADYGDVTVSAGGATWTIDNDVVSDAKLRNSAALSVIGRSANSTGDPADIAAGTDGHVLRRSGTTLGFGTVALAGLADLAQSTIIGRAEGAGTGVPQALTPTQVVAIIDGESPTWTGAHTFTGSAITANVTNDVLLGATSGVGLFAGMATAGVNTGDIAFNASGGIAINADTSATTVLGAADGDVLVTASSDIVLSATADIALNATSGIAISAAGTPVTTAATGTLDMNATTVDVDATTVDVDATGAMALTAGTTLTLTGGTEVTVPSPLSAGGTVEVDGVATFNSSLVAHGTTQLNARYRLTGLIGPTLSANTDNWNPTGLSISCVIRVTLTNICQLSGIVAPTSGTVLHIFRVDTDTDNLFSLLHQSLSSDAENRFILPGESTLFISVGCSVSLWYDSTQSRWRVLSVTMPP